MDTIYICEGILSGECPNEAGDTMCKHHTPHSWQDSNDLYSGLSECKRGNCGRLRKPVKCVPYTTDWDE